MLADFLLIGVDRGATAFDLREQDIDAEGLIRLILDDTDLLAELFGLHVGGTDDA